MRRRADACGYEIELPRPGFGEINQIFDVFHRQRWMGGEQARCGSHQTHSGEVAERIVRQLFVQAGVDRKRSGASKQQRIAVRDGARRELGADNAASAAADGYTLLFGGTASLAIN